MMGMTIYLIHLAGDVGDLFTSAKSTATGSEKAWAWVYMISYWFGSLSGINNTKPVNSNTCVKNFGPRIN